MAKKFKKAVIEKARRAINDIIVAYGAVPTIYRSHRFETAAGPLDVSFSVEPDMVTFHSSFDDVDRAWRFFYGDGRKTYNGVLNPNSGKYNFYFTPDCLNAGDTIGEMVNSITLWFEGHLIKANYEGLPLMADRPVKFTPFKANPAKIEYPAIYENRGDYSINDACYSKGKKAVRCPSTTGYKTRAARLAERLANGRYSGRSGAYIMSPSAAARFEKLFAEGWDANCIRGTLEEPERAEAA